MWPVNQLAGITDWKLNSFSLRSTEPAGEPKRWFIWWPTNEFDVILLTLSGRCQQIIQVTGPESLHLLISRVLLIIRFPLNGRERQATGQISDNHYDKVIRTRRTRSRNSSPTDRPSEKIRAEQITFKWNLLASAPPNHSLQSVRQWNWKLRWLSLDFR